MVPVDSALSAVVPATMSVIEDVIGATFELHSRADSDYRRALLDWIGPAMAARVRREAGPDVPVRPPLAELVSEPRAEAAPRFVGDVVDAEVIPDDDDDDDPDTYEEGDDELVAQVERLRAEAGMSS